MASQQVARRQRRQALNLAGALAVGVLVAAPSSAFASTVVATGDGGLAYRTVDTETNDLTITQDLALGRITFSDAGVAVQVDPAQAPGCEKVGRAVRCATPTSPDPAGYPLTVQLGGQDDRLDNQTSIRTTVTGGDGMDTILGSSARDVITGGRGNDTVSGRGGNDYIDIAGSFPDSADCGDGEDRVLADLADTVGADCEIVRRTTSADNTTPPVDTSKPGGTAPPSADTGQVVPTPIPGACKNNIEGTAAADTLTGTPAGDSILGLGGNDSINALGGDDCLYGGDGTDVLRGGAGRDFVSGEAGNDRLIGAGGADGLTGGGGNDRVSGGAGPDRIAGDVGDDVLTGNGERDRLFGGAGNDRLSGGAGIDRLYGGAGNDRLSGGPSTNVLHGGNGRDTIIAINGTFDRINCGKGRDTVRADARDRVARTCEVVNRRR